MIFNEYLTTVFLSPLPESDWPPNFQILTAHNPRRLLSEADNNAADTELRTQLQREHVSHFRITGASADLVHQEAGWGLLEIVLERAIALGRQHGQYAIFDVRNGEVFVVSCDTLEERSLGAFKARLRNR